MDMTIAKVAGIVVICYLIGCAIRATSIKNELIPVIVGVCGGILGIVGMYTMPSFPATNVIDAIAVGIVSGFAATGVNQVYKQTKQLS